MSVQQKFRGCLLGVLAGDCFGAPFEGRQSVPLRDAVALVKAYSHSGQQDLEPRRAGCRLRRALRFTDDSMMTLSVARSLLDMNKLDAFDLLHKFATSFKDEPHRGYGGNIITIFNRFDPTDTVQKEDPCRLAREQFDGGGSYGNGGGMRAAPVPMFALGDKDEMLQIAKGQSMVTHTHPHGVMGSLLQSCAVYFALMHDLNNDFSAHDFVTSVSATLEQPAAELYAGKANAFNERLAAISSLLESPSTTTEEVVRTLGHGIAALESVPTALYCFLRCLSPHPELDELTRDSPADNPIARTVAYAISLGGDTDTIASMAGAIAGAYHGERGIPKAWFDRLEGANTMVDLANQLYARHASVECSGSAAS